MSAPRLLLALALLAPPAAAQSFVDNEIDIPQGSGDTEQIDFADVDLDGDWDAALAQGGDNGGEQNELWINQGGLSGGALGVFADETAARLPAVVDPSRDVEFADVDGDADHDLYVVRHATFQSIGAAWWINQGGEQGGALGYYADDTPGRFVGLGGPGSSVAPSLVLPSGSFIDWSGDADFADLDGDGDLDLVHSSYGGAYSGTTPTRLFLNDGDGRFTEFNPSGFQLASASIADGDPALWCSGTQMHGTQDTTGTFADVADGIVDLEVADVDGDFDLEPLWAGRNQVEPRLFRNELDLGALAFRDDSPNGFPGLSAGTGTYEQELGDLDGDGDLDLYGLNWGTGTFSFPDLLLENVAGAFLDQGFVLPGSGSDEEEGDFLDYDADGDLDLYVADFSGADSLYRNDGGFAFVDVSATELPPTGLTSISRDCEVADVDGDGDHDVFVANAYGYPNVYLENVTGVPDATPPSIPLVEALADAPAASGERRVRAHVYDNAPLYAVWYYPTELAVTVDGVALDAFPMTSSRGQVFRGALPANLVGAVDYAVRSTDGQGNHGVSATRSYTATGATGTPYGVGSGASGLPAPTLAALSEPRAGAPLYLAGQGQPGAGTLLGASLAPQTPPLAVPGVPNLVLNVDPAALIVVAPAAADAAGTSVFAFDLPAGIAGTTLYTQLVELAAGTVGSSQGLQLDVL